MTGRARPASGGRGVPGVAGLAVILTMACGPGATTGTATPETLGSAVAEADELVPGVAMAPPTVVAEVIDTAIDGDEPAVEAPIGPPLPPLSTAEQVLDVIDAVHGPTSDVSAQMNRLIGFPQLATPPGSEVREVRADVREAATGDRYVLTSEVLLGADGTVDELVAFYDDQFVQLGWTAEARTGVGAGRTRVEQITYLIPGSAYDQGDVQLAVLADTSLGGGAGDTTPSAARSMVRLRVVELSEVDGPRSPRERFEGWIGELPLPAGGVVTGAAIQTSSVGRQSLHYSLAVRYEGVTPEDVASSLRAALPTANYSIDPQPSMGETLDAWVYLDHPFFAEARVSPHPYGPNDEPLGTVVNVDARVEFSARQ